MKISAPSFIIPATRKENSLYLKELVDEVELLFFDSLHDFDMPEDSEIHDLLSTGMRFSAHLPTDADLNTKSGWKMIDRYISKLEILNISRFILHPVESKFFLDELVKRNKHNIIIENTDFYGSFFDDAVSKGVRLCLDNAHAGELAGDFLSIYDVFIEEFHLQGSADGKHHKSLEYIDEGLLKSILCSADKNGSTVCLEVFNESDFIKSHEILKGLI